MDNKQHINKLTEIGYSSIKGILSDKEVNYFKKYVGSKHIDKLSRKEKVFYDVRNNYFKNLKYYFINNKINKIINKFELKKIASEAIGSKVELERVDGYFSEISKNFILDWHVDRAYSGNPKPEKFLSPDDYAIKCILYLDDVETQNGCLGIIKKSNKITYYIRKGIFEGKITYEPYWKLVDLLQYVKKNEIYNYISKFISEDVIKNFIKDSEFILKSKDTFDFDISHKKGDLLIFDETVVHRAAESLNTSRSIIRLFFK